MPPEPNLLALEALPWRLEGPGSGGQIGGAPEDFRVEEIPAYVPAGEGEHCFVRIRKRDLTSAEAAKRLARALGRRTGDVGMAGMKDRRAVTEQWMSVPEVTPEAVLAVRVPGLEILEAALHGNKLRTGHLQGNRFSIRLVGLGPDGVARATARLEALQRRGQLHVFGPQRFGRRGANLGSGLALLRERGRDRGRGDRRQRRLLVSAVQSALFNHYLARRLQEGPLEEPLAGEILQLRPRGGSFRCDDPVKEAARFARGELVPTGPLYGPRMRPPAADRPAALEAETLEAGGLTRDDFAAFKKLAPGGRRPLLVWPEAGEVQAAAPDGAWLHFVLPPGAYATVLLREITQTPFETLRASAAACEADDSGLP